SNGLATGVALGMTLITATDPTTGIISNSVTLTVASALAYAVNFNNGNVNGSVSQFAIAADGSLTTLTSPTVNAGANPYSLAVDPSNQYLYVANYTQP